MYILPDASLTLHTLLRALSTVSDFWDGGVLVWLGVPNSMRDRFRVSQLESSEEEKRTAVLQYLLQTLPDMSWRRVAGVLWYLQEHTALETVRQCIPHQPGEYAILYSTTHYCWFAEFHDSVPRTKSGILAGQITIFVNHLHVLMLIVAAIHILMQAVTYM